MTAWMIHCVAVAALVTLAATAAEAALRAMERPARGAWVAALAAALAIPGWSLLRPPTPPPPGESAGWAVLGEIEVALAGAAAAPAPFPLDAVLRWGWAAASVLVLGSLALAAWRIHRLRRGWRRAELDGTPVLVSRDTGPAVIGVLRGEIVVPAWVAGLAPDARRLLLEHEREHLRAGDLRLLAASLLAVAAMPWNPLLWWQLHRLRLAIEVDCDARVLRRHPEVGAYGTALIEAGRRVSRGNLAMAAFAERRSTLERRIRMMTMPRPPHPLRRAVVLGAVALAGIAAACEVPAPTPLQPEPPPPDAPVQAASPSLGDQPVFTPRTQEPRLDGDQRRLLMQRLERDLPADLRASGTMSRAMFWVFIDEQGRTGNIRIVESSGNPEFDRVAQEALSAVTWTPARNREENVPVWIQLPVAFQSMPPTRATAPAGAAGGMTAPAASLPSPPLPATPPLAPRVGELGTVPTFTPRTQEPRLLNREAFVRTLREYAASLEEENLSGRAVLWVFIDAEGRVGNARVVESSGQTLVDAVALAAIREARFEPARNRDAAVPVWIQLPIVVGGGS